MYKREFMLLAVSLADKVKGISSPNPNVGAVIVKNNEVIGKGFTQLYGKDHAEIQALKSCTKDPIDADLYVTLEPCSHYGKTPPCTDAIIKAGIKNVYAGIKDPNPKVNGQGFQTLNKAGINTKYPYCENIIKKQLEYYLHWMKYKKPFVILKNAVSLDGKIAAENGESKWITNEASRNKVHHLRQEVDAVMTTINTVIKDDPLLNVRLDEVKSHPQRVILDPKLQIPTESQIFQTMSQYKTILFYDKNMKFDPMAKKKLHQCQTVAVSCENYLLNIDEVLSALAEMNITSVLIEAGPTLSSCLLKNNLVNKLYYFIAPKILGGTKNVFDHLDITNLVQQINLQDINIEILNSDILVTGYLKKK